MTFYPDFKVTTFVNIEYLRYDPRQSHSYYRTSIGSHMRSIAWWQFQWPWRTANPVFKVMAFLKSIISNALRFTDSFYRTLIGNHTESIEWSTFTWAAQPGCVGGGQCPSHFWDQRGTGGYRGTVQWKWSLLLQQTIFIQYCTSDWISTPLTLVDTCQVNDIWKDGLSRVSTVHPHWTAALFKSTCQRAHVAVNWLSMSVSRTYLPNIFGL